MLEYVKFIIEKYIMERSYGYDEYYNISLFCSGTSIFFLLFAILFYKILGIGGAYEEIKKYKKEEKRWSITKQDISIASDKTVFDEKI